MPPTSRLPRDPKALARLALAEGRNAVLRARVLVETSLRVELHQGLRPPGIAALLREVAKGRLTVSTLFRFLGANDPDRTALVEPRSLGPNGEPTGVADRTISFAELDRRIDGVTAGLRARGLGRGDAVLILLKNRVEFVEIQAGTGRLGGSAVSVSYRSTPPELEFLARHSGAKALVFEASLAPVVEEALERLSRPSEDGPSRLERRACFALGGDVPGFASYDQLPTAARADAADHSDEAAVVMYTSGTTGRPKGAVRRFPKSIFASAMAFIGRTAMHKHDVHVVTCPLYHATAFGFTSLTFVLGGTVVVLPEFRPELFLAAVQRYRATTTAVVPTLLYRTLELGRDRIRTWDTSSLRAIFSGGAPLPPSVSDATLEVFGPVLYNFYGATETGLVTVAGPEDLAVSPGTIGRPIPFVDVRLFDEDGREVPDGEVGELFVRSELLVDGYHNDERATRGSMRDEYFTVGDLARKDARGLFHVEGRKRDLIISGGTNVYPAEVEAALDAHPDVAEAAVVGVPDPEWGERVKAFVVPRPGVEPSPDDLRAFLRRRLAGPKVPREIVLLAELPKNPTGKVLKRDLRNY